VTLGDLDRNGRDDVVIDFGAGHGLWMYANDGSWTELHGLSPVALAFAALP
jgi:hypothetical protein